MARWVRSANATLDGFHEAVAESSERVLKNSADHSNSSGGGVGCLASAVQAA